MLHLQFKLRSTQGFQFPGNPPSSNLYLGSILKLDPLSFPTQFLSTQNQQKDTTRLLRTLLRQKISNPSKPTKGGNPAKTTKLVTKSSSPQKTYQHNTEHQNYSLNG